MMKRWAFGRVSRYDKYFRPQVVSLKKTSLGPPPPAKLDCWKEMLSSPVRMDVTGPDTFAPKAVPSSRSNSVRWCRTHEAMASV